MKLTTPKESDVQAQVIDLIHALGGVAIRTNSGAMKVENRFIRFNSEPGCSDVIGVVPHPTRGGVPVALECKKPNWKPAGTDSKDTERVMREARQRAFLDKWVKAGGLGLFVRSVDDLQAALRLEGFDV